MLTVSETEALEKRSEARARPARVALFGGFGIGNFGNDASLEAVLEFLRAHRPEAELSCICTNPAVVTRKFGAPAIPTVLRPRGLWRFADTLLLRQPSAWTNWFYSLGALRRFDAIVVAGTGVFDDFRDTPLGWPSRLLRWCLAARLRGVRVAFLSVGGGPILNPVSRVLMKWAAQLAQHRSYRDANSLAYMQSIGVDESASAVLPDLAFLLPPPPEPERPAGAPLTVGVGVMNYRGWRESDAIYREYVETHARFINWLEAQGHKVRIVIGQAPTDLVAARDIETRLGRPLIGPREESMSSFHDAMAAIAETDLVVASRYHVQIAALKLGRPLISLSYAPKNDALLEEVGLGEFVQDVHKIDFDLLTRQFDTLARERAHYVGVVRGRVRIMEERLRRALKELDLLGD
jgi:polysaccharide pyruvyl transferase WcaK-like protein